MALESPYYSYVPTRWVTILVLVLFTVSTVIHIGQAAHYRTWWLFTTLVVAGLAEIAGWGARVHSSIQPANYAAYLILMISTSLAPTFIVAANLIILGRIITQVGTHYSRIPPRLYAIIFCSADAITLAIQGAGCGMSMSGAAQSDLVTANHGARIMLSGICIQLGIMFVYAFFALEFFVRYARDLPVRRLETQTLESLKSPKARMTPNLQMMTRVLILSTILLLTRNIYRVIEFKNGWSGKIISTEFYFNVFDGAMIILAMYVMNLVHPGHFLEPEQSLPYGDASWLEIKDEYSSKSSMGSFFTHATLR